MISLTASLFLRQDMAWAEISFATSPEHERLIGALHDIFYRPAPANFTDMESASDLDCEEKKEDYLYYRSQQWAPHLSLCYDNPEGFGCTLSRSLFEQFLKEKCPTLFEDGKNSNVGLRRAVTGLTLWKTSGKMAEWECLERLTLGRLRLVDL
jgi:hypothetical protein